MGQDERIVVDVDDPAGRHDRLGHLVGVEGGVQPGADIEELADPLGAGQIAHRTEQKAPSGAGDVDDGGGCGSEPVRRIPGRSGSCLCRLASSSRPGPGSPGWCRSPGGGADRVSVRWYGVALFGFPRLT